MMFAELAARKAASQEGGDGEINAQRPLNPFMVGQPVLQKKNVEKVFTDHDFPSYVQQSGNATSRLRLLDSIRLHNPLEIECTRFNLPSSRLNVLVLKDVLHLCGGLVGARFSSEELLQCKSLVKQLSDLWASIELKYKGLSASQKKIQWNAASSTSNSSEEANKEVEDVNRFFEETNEFLTKLQELQELIRKVQDSVDPEEAAKFDNTDPESKIGKKMPDFLSVLLTRFNGGPLPESGKPVGLTVGKFAVYLSGLMGPSTRGQLTPSESEALSLLLQASNDCQSTFTNQQMDQNLSGCLPAMNQKYWAQRFFNFLSVMTELQSTPKDEKQLQNLV